MKIVTKYDLENNFRRNFTNGFIKAFDVLGVLNKYEDLSVKNIETSSYLDSFVNVGEYLRKNIKTELNSGRK